MCPPPSCSPISGDCETALKDVRARLKAVDKEIAGADQQDAYGRLSNVIDYVEQAISSTDPQLVPLGIFVQISGNLGELGVSLQNFVDSRDPIQPGAQAVEAGRRARTPGCSHDSARHERRARALDALTATSLV
jgi:hypothetical protein